MGNEHSKSWMPAELDPFKSRAQELFCGTCPALRRAGMDPGTSPGDVAAFVCQARKKKSGDHIFHHFKPEVYLTSLQSLTEFYTCRGGFYFEYPLNTLWVGVFPVLEQYVYSDK